MTRHEKDRENLMKDAQALTRRVSFRSSSEEKSAPFLEVVAGIRENGFLSVYFDQDPVFHFDDRNRLRRAFVDHFLYRSQGSTLARMRRERTVEKTVLQRQDLNDHELEQFQSRTIDTVDRFLNFLNQSTACVEKIIPADDDSLVPEILVRLEEIKQQKCPLSPAMATKPN